SAMVAASMGELDLGFNVPRASRYLWDFATLPGWRGLGIYPALLQTILRDEGADAERFWIGHLLRNSASRRGIEKAGFQEVGRLEARADGAVVLVPVVHRERRAAAAVEMFGCGLTDKIQRPAPSDRREACSSCVALSPRSSRSNRRPTAPVRPAARG